MFANLEGGLVYYIHVHANFPCSQPSSEPYLEGELGGGGGGQLPPPSEI